MASAKINVCALHANISCICLQIRQILKILGKSYKIHACYSHASVKFKVSCTVLVHKSINASPCCHAKCGIKPVENLRTYVCTVGVNKKVTFVIVITL